MLRQGGWAGGRNRRNGGFFVGESGECGPLELWAVSRVLEAAAGAYWSLLAFAWTYETAHGQLSASERVLVGSCGFCGFCGLCLVPLMDSVRGFILDAEVRGKGHGRRSGKLGWAMSEEAVRK